MGWKFLKITTCEKKIGFLLIEIFRKFFNPQNYGYLDQHRVAIFFSVSGQQKSPTEIREAFCKSM
jgi:hypothetical protein